MTEQSHIDDSWYVRPPGFRHRTGAGGVVVRVENDRLLVALVKEVEIGDHHYVLPKGGVEPGEDLETAALREIQEESGLIDLTRLGALGTLARQNFKKTYWQSSHYGLYRTEQIEGEATDPANYGLAWFPIEELPPLCWPDEKMLLEANRRRIRSRIEQIP